MRIRAANSLVLLLYAALAAATALSFSSFSRAQQRAISAARRQLQATTEVARFLSGSKLLTSNVQSYAATGTVQFANAYWRELYVTRSRDRAAAALQKLGLTAQEWALILRARSESDSLIERERQAIETARRGALQRAIELVFGPEYQQALIRIYSPGEQLQQRITTRLAAEVARERQAAGSLWTLCLLLLLLDLVLVFVVLALVYPRFITRPLLQLDQRLQQLSSGAEAAPLQLAGVATEVRELAESLAVQERLSRQLARDQWAKAQQVRISAVLQQQTSRPALASCLLQEIATLVQLGAATAYGVEDCGTDGLENPGAAGQQCLQLLATYAIHGAAVPMRLGFGEGLVGECLRLGKPLEVADPPAGYLPVCSGLGHCAPQSLLLLPVRSGTRNLAVLELALLGSLAPHERELLIDLLPFVALALEGLEPSGFPDRTALDAAPLPPTSPTPAALA